VHQRVAHRAEHQTGELAVTAGPDDDQLRGVRLLDEQVADLVVPEPAESRG
jgi:hypothetical protein